MQEGKPTGFGGKVWDVSFFLGFWPRKFWCYVFVTQSDVERKVNDICNTTFLGDFVVGDVKIKLNTSGNSYTEIWALKIPVSMRSSLKRYYEACAEKCGYIF